MSTEYRNFLALSYEELEELNLAAKADRINRIAIDEIREKRIKYLTDEKRIKAVTVLFSDLEGRLHLLDYDKKFLLGRVREFDLRRLVDPRLHRAKRERFAPRHRLEAPSTGCQPTCSGNGKVLVFGVVIDKDGTLYSGDLRGVLKNLRRQALWRKKATR